MLTAVCRKNKQAIVSGFHEREGNELFNSSILITEKGITGKYRKIHLFMNEKNIFSKGNLGLPVYQVEDFKLGMLVCFDYLFPEIWRIMALKGADIIAHPSNLVTNNAYKVVPAHAVINKMFIFTSNRIGNEREINFSGKSFAVNPDGEVFSSASSDSTEILKTIINPLESRNKMITERNHVLNDRFPGEYDDILAL
jgi:predicted amidohydrolase